MKDRKIVVARELTKIHEEFLSGTASEILENKHFITKKIQSTKKNILSAHQFFIEGDKRTD